MKMAPAPISTPISGSNQLDPSWMRWLNRIGVHLGDATSVSSIKTNEETIHYTVNGTITYINYTGKGGFTSSLPNKCTRISLIPVSDKSHLTLQANVKLIEIPSFTEEVTIDGYYFNA